MQEGFIRLAGNGFLPDAFEIAVFGLSGLDTPKDEGPYRTMISWATKPLQRQLKRTVIISDALLPLFAENHRYGVALIGGTGSIALALEPNGRLHRVGGWGYNVSDEGSGQWIGLEALRLILRTYDAFGQEFAQSVNGPGRRRQSAEQAAWTDVSALTADVLRQAGVGSVDELAIWCSDMTSPAAAASLARSVIHSNSTAATKIVHRAAKSLAALGISALLRIEPRYRSDSPIILSGGLFGNEMLRKTTVSEIQDRFEGSARVLVSGHDPAYGAAVLGARILEGETEPPMFPSSMKARRRRSQV